MPRKSKMNIDMKTINIIGLVVIVGLSIYIYMLLEQIQTPTEGCKTCEDNIRENMTIDRVVYDDKPPVPTGPRTLADGVDMYGKPYYIDTATGRRYYDDKPHVDMYGKPYYIDTATGRRYYDDTPMTDKPLNKPTTNKPTTNKPYTPSKEDVIAQMKAWIN
jgi:hypothetical protein